MLPGMQRQAWAPDRPLRGVRADAVRLTVAGWAVGLATTALVLGTPLLVPAYRNPELHLVLDTADTCIALLVAYLLHGRFLRSHRLQDLLLSQALLLLAVAGLGLSLVLGLLGDHAPGTVDAWLPVGLRSCAAALVLAAAFAGDRRVEGTGGRARLVTLAGVVAVFLLLWSLRDSLPVAVVEQDVESAARPSLSGHPLVLLAYAVATVCFLVASAAFTRRTRVGEGGRPDSLLVCLGPAFALAGFARVNYLLYPSLYSGWLYTGDLLRTASYVVLLVGAAREIRQYWVAQADAAVLADRRRLARDLHDGVVQELAYIRLETVGMEGDGEVKLRVVESCDRATDEARAAVDALGRGADEPLGQVLHRAARHVADRYDARLDVELDPTVTAHPDHQYALVRITREAVSNAIRHGRVSQVCLRLCHDDHGRRRLLVVDDGGGFDPSEADGTASGFGIRSMEERARGLDGTVDIRSEPGKGTTVEVTW